MVSDSDYRQVFKMFCCKGELKNGVATKKGYGVKKVYMGLFLFVLFLEWEVIVHARVNDQVKKIK